MSGTASMGSLVSDHAPDTAAANVTSSTSQRLCTDRARMRSIIAWSILGQRFQQLRFEQKRIGYRDRVAGTEPGQHLHPALIALTKDDLTPLEAVGELHENDRRRADVLDCVRRNRHGDDLFLESDRSSDEGARPPHAAVVRYLHHSARGAAVLVEHRADEYDLAVSGRIDAAARDRYGLSLPDQVQIGWTDGEIDPDRIKIGHDEKLRFQVIAPDRCTEVNPALDDAACKRRANFLAAQEGFGLVGQVRDLGFRQAQGKQLLPGNVVPHLRVCRLISGAKELLFGRNLFVPKDLFPLEQVLLQLVGQPRRKIFTLCIRKFAAL